MATKRHLQLRTVRQKHKTVHLTKKIRKQKLKKTRINKLVGGIPKEKVHTIEHILFKTWPDHGVPNMEEFKVFINSIYNDMKDNGGNTVIHCSAGVGRTGVVYVILVLLSQKYVYFNKGSENKTIINDELIYKINQIILNERQRRNNKFVQTNEQYNFIYKFFTGEDMQKVIDEKPVKYPTLFTNLILPSEQECKLYDGDESRNRYKDVLPCEEYRVKLNSDIYINASHLSDINIKKVIFSNNIKIIASQGPTEISQSDFYEMLVQYNIKRIIMLTQIKEKGKDKCFDYFFSDPEKYEPGPVTETIYPYYVTVTQDSTHNSIDTERRTILIKPIIKDSPTNPVSQNIDVTHGVKPIKSHVAYNGMHFGPNSNSVVNPVKNLNYFLSKKKHYGDLMIYLSVCDCKVILVYIMRNCNLDKDTQQKCIELIKTNPTTIQETNTRFKKLLTKIAGKGSKSNKQKFQKIFSDIIQNILGYEPIIDIYSTQPSVYHQSIKDPMIYGMVKNDEYNRLFKGDEAIMEPLFNNIFDTDGSLKISNSAVSNGLFSNKYLDDVSNLIKFLNTKMRKVANILKFMLSFCDCKIILVYILRHKLLDNHENGSLLDNHENGSLLGLIKREPVKKPEGGGPSLDNINFINSIWNDILTVLLGPQNQPRGISISTCSNRELITQSKETGDELYTILFKDDPQIIDIVNSIFNGTGSVKNLVALDAIYLPDESTA